VVSAQIKEEIDTLPQLEQPKFIRTKYVNFDFIKLMLGQGTTTENPGFEPVTASYHWQILVPWALFKNYKINVGYGLAMGSNRIGFRNMNFAPTNSGSVLVPDAAIEKLIIKSGYIGVVVLPIVELSRRLTLYAGAEVDFNIFSNKAFLKFDDDHSLRVKIKKYTNRVSVPVQVQLSMSNKRKTLSYGIFGRRDLIPRFKNIADDKIKQFSAGISGALII
jgi:hypothetical protein